jgi:ABC-type dipeptide/oligopeptide/nickel transport system permease subunit
MSKKNMIMLLTLLFTCLAFFGLGEFGLSHWELMLSSLNAFLINSRVSVALFPRFAQNLMLFLCQIHHEITSGQIHSAE